MNPLIHMEPFLKDLINNTLGQINQIKYNQDIRNHIQDEL